MKLFKKKSTGTSAKEVDQVNPQQQADPAIKDKRKSVSPPKRWRVILVGVFILILFAGSGASIGYAAGIQQRLAQQNQQRLVTAATHFNYGVGAMLQNNFEVARLQFEYVLKIYPDFPELKEKYTQTILELTKNDLPTSTPATTPTPDMRGVEALFSQAQQEVNSKNGTAALKTLDILRNQDIKYRTLEVDALYYMALRFSGLDKISRQADQEGGLYDLTLASRFAPLDHDAVQYANWARNYITAISYWNVNWEKVVFYLAQVYTASPGLQDSKGNSARTRHIEALWRYGDALMANDQFCDAVKYYKGSISIQEDGTVQAKLANANNKCMGPSLTQQAIPTATTAPLVIETPTPTVDPGTPPGP
jgi:tetratricopeptide (TPR) repeat protein